MTVQDIVGWDADLQALTDGLNSMFNRPEPKATFRLMMRALLADVPKSSWGLAEFAGLPTPRPFDHLLDGADDARSCGGGGVPFGWFAAAAT